MTGEGAADAGTRATGYETSLFELPPGTYRIMAPLGDLTVIVPEK